MFESHLRQRLVLLLVDPLVENVFGDCTFVVYVGKFALHPLQFVQGRQDLFGEVVVELVLLETPERIVEFHADNLLPKRRKVDEQVVYPIFGDLGVNLAMG